jgi:hypothetical protein
LYNWIEFLRSHAVALPRLAKFAIATAQIAGRAFKYSRNTRLTVWSLTLPQVAATLAAALVAYETYDPARQRLLDAGLLNVVLVLMLATSILGPVLTERFTPRMLADLELAWGRSGDLNVAHS